MASGALFQMDQTAPQNQIVFRHRRECGQESTLDRHFGLRAHSHHQKTACTQSRPLHNVTNVESDPVRENAIKSITYEHELQG